MISFILAGGFAKRMWPLTRDYPKCLLPVGGKPILVDILEKLGNMKAYVSTNEKFAEKISSAISRFDAELVIEPANSNEEKLGSIGALIRFVEEYSINDDILLVAADNYFEESLKEFVKDFDGVPLIGVYDIKDISLAKNYGVVTEKDGFATDFNEKPNSPKSTLIGTGVYLLPKDCIGAIKSIPINQRDHLGGIVENLIEKHKVKLFRFKGTWADIGSVQEYIDLNKKISNGECYFEHCKIDSSSITNSIFLGKTTIQNSKITSSIILDSEIKNATLEKKVVVGKKIVSYTSSSSE